jgi:4-hydroxy-2-oxoglutarate aldolase
MTNQDLINKLNGILLPFTTPFSKDGQILSEALVANLARWNVSGITGYAALGSTGERVHLDEREYLQIIETARAAVPSSMAFIAGAGQQSVIGTINEIKKAANGGADAVLVITPNFYRTAITQEALLAFYRAVADAAAVPVLLYSMPALTGIKIEPATIAELSSHPNIIGVKDSSNDIAGFKSTVELCPRSFVVMTGNGTVLLDALQAGATGGILAVGCTVPEICVEILRAHRSGEAETASELQTKLTPLAAAVTTKFGIGGLKTALELSGYRGGLVRAPLRMPDQAACEEIKLLLDEAMSSLGAQAARLPS